MNIIHICIRSGKKIIRYTLSSPNVVKTKKGVFLPIFNLISSMESYTNILISYPQSSDWKVAVTWDLIIFKSLNIFKYSNIFLNIFCE